MVEQEQSISAKLTKEGRPWMYDVCIDEIRAVTQQDVDQWQLLANEFVFFRHELTTYLADKSQFSYCTQLKKLLARSKERFAKNIRGLQVLPRRADHKPEARLAEHGKKY